MKIWITLPFLIQALAIGIDEIYFHLKRGLPKWERIGHPLDTLSVLLCFLLALFFPYSESFLKGYIALAILSCVMVTKDEFIHKHHCPAFEHWIHAFLFLNHPILLTCIALIWKSSSPPLLLFLSVQTCLVALFFFYQVIFWNFLWRRNER
jgi:hypothetical protein